MEDDFDMAPVPPMNEDDDFMDGGDEEEAVSFMKVGEEKEIGNQGLKKKLIKDGQGFDFPDSGDEVEGTTTTTSGIGYNFNLVLLIIIGWYYLCIICNC